MNQKEEKILEEIKKYYYINRRMPTIRYLQHIFSYKSTNSIYRYLKKLEEKYLIRNKENKITIDNSLLKYDDNLKKVQIINRKNSFINLILNKRNNYIAYQVNNNYLKKYGFIKNDLLIIQKNKKLNNNDIGLFVIDNKKRIMNYNYLDGFYILKDNEELILNKVNLIGKVIMIERKI